MAAKIIHHHGWANHSPSDTGGPRLGITEEEFNVSVSLNVVGEVGDLTDFFHREPVVVQVLDVHILIDVENERTGL